MSGTKEVERRLRLLCHHMIWLNEIGKLVYEVFSNIDNPNMIPDAKALTEQFISPKNTFWNFDTLNLNTDEWKFDGSHKNLSNIVESATQRPLDGNYIAATYEQLRSSLHKAYNNEIDEFLVDSFLSFCRQFESDDDLLVLPLHICTQEELFYLRIPNMTWYDITHYMITLFKEGNREGQGCTSLIDRLNSVDLSSGNKIFSMAKFVRITANIDDGGDEEEKDIWSSFLFQQCEENNESEILIFDVNPEVIDQIVLNEIGVQFAMVCKMGKFLRSQFDEHEIKLNCNCITVKYDTTDINNDTNKEQIQEYRNQSALHGLFLAMVFAFGLIDHDVLPSVRAVLEGNKLTFIDVIRNCMFASAYGGALFEILYGISSTKSK